MSFSYSRRHLQILSSCVLLIAFTLVSAGPAAAVEQIAAGFGGLKKGEKVVLMPTDVELFSMSAGGMNEPRADWTEAATKHFNQALLKKRKALGLVSLDLASEEADSFSDISALHAAVAQAINTHHFGHSGFNLPTKEGKLDWSMGEAVKPIQEKTQADYALFTWVRDSYASAERKAAMLAMAFLGVGLTGGTQLGYASLVDLRTGQVVWFNRLISSTGDLREEDKAKDTVDSLLNKFPTPQ
ncbi:MAG: hypothetical protein ACOYNW_01565 [Undibacterium curvum]|uniref:Uncharacterized protein n=1 Tax=Undibacterium curvum TaxID=2762294 RepID=A0ABR7A6C8_9BURK|nr:hypothetical protein [Undibacterium curvum]MBC3932217.1 hypothetical protein [Undibacterium curvum]